MEEMQDSSATSLGFRMPDLPCNDVISLLGAQGVQGLQRKGSKIWGEITENDDAIS